MILAVFMLLMTAGLSGTAQASPSASSVKHSVMSITSTSSITADIAHGPTQAAVSWDCGYAYYGYTFCITYYQGYYYGYWFYTHHYYYYSYYYNQWVDIGAQ